MTKSLLAILALGAATAVGLGRAEAAEPKPPLSTAPALAPYDMGSPQVTDLWVDPASGDDARGGASRDQALRTLRAAWERIPAKAPLRQGYRILIAPGTLDASAVPNYWESRFGTFEHPVIVQAADGPGTVTLPSVNVFDCRYLYLIGLRIVAGGGDVLHFEKVDHGLLRQVTVEGTGDIHNYASPQEAFKANQSQHLYVEDSDISGAWDNALDFVAVQYGHILGNRIHRAHDWVMYLKGGSAYFRVEGNEIYDGGTGGFTAGQGTGMEFMVAPWLNYEAYDVKLVNNVVHDTAGAGVGVQGGYNILIAHNTMFRVGSTSHAIEIGCGDRTCDGDPQTAGQYLKLGGWGATKVGADEPIPNRNVFVYNNVVYNPEGFRSQWQHFAIQDPRKAGAESNIPSPARGDVNLQIRGNVIWNGPADLPLGVEDAHGSVTAAQLRAENSINLFQPQWVDPDHGDYRALPGGKPASAKVYAIPDFSWTDAPQPLNPPPGDNSNAVTSGGVGAAPPRKDHRPGGGNS